MQFALNATADSKYVMYCCITAKQHLWHPHSSIGSTVCACALQMIEMGGRDATLKSVFSNGVLTMKSMIVRVQKMANLNFTKVASKTTASVHIKNKDLNTSLVVAFDRSGYDAAYCAECMPSVHLTSLYAEKIAYMPSNAFAILCRNFTGCCAVTS